MEAIDDLPDQQKIAYTLASFEKLKGEEIAQVMETTLSAVESLLHRARANLREKLRTYHQVAAKPQNPKEGRRVGPPGSGQKPQDSMRDGPSGPLPDPGGAGGSLAEIPKTITGTGLPERTKEKEAGDG